MNRNTYRLALVVAGSAVAVAVLEATGHFLRARLMGEAATWSWHVLRALGVWLSMAVLTPVPLAMAAHFPLVPGALMRRLPLHFAAAVLFVCGHLVLDILVQGYDFTLGTRAFLRQFTLLFTSYVAVELVIYGGIVGVVLYLRAREEAAARALASESLRRELSDARLAALSSQLAPHFLFNTLNAVSTLALQGERERVSEALTTLSDLLRAVLDERAPAAGPLRGELEFLERYLELQRMRFGDRLQTQVHATAEAAEVPIPRLLLQPLVENAVQHGLHGSEGGCVSLHATCEREELVIEISDRAARGPSAPAAEPSTGLGLRNVRSRLQQVYGSAASLQMQRGDAGTTVCLRLPVRFPPAVT